GDDLVGGDGDRSDLFGVARVLANVLFAQVGLVENLATPLFDRGDARRQDEGRFLDERHGGKTDDRFPRPARQDDDATATLQFSNGVIDVGRLPLVIADSKRQARASQRAQVRGQRGSFNVPGEILGRVADLDQGQLEYTPVRRVDGKTALVQLVAQVAA